MERKESEKLLAYSLGADNLTQEEVMGIMDREFLKSLKEPKFLEYLRTCPCHTCGKPPPSTASHMAPSNFGRKGPDKYSIPQCFECHMDHEYMGSERFERKYGRSKPTIDDSYSYYETYQKLKGL